MLCLLGAVDPGAVEQLMEKRNDTLELLINENGKVSEGSGVESYFIVGGVQNRLLTILNNLTGGDPMVLGKMNFFYNREDLSSSSSVYYSKKHRSYAMTMKLAARSQDSRGPATFPIHYVANLSFSNKGKLQYEEIKVVSKLQYDFDFDPSKGDDLILEDWAEDLNKAILDMGFKPTHWRLITNGIFEVNRYLLK